MIILIPFLFSVSGILVIESHCICIGKNQVTFYLAPETCSDILDDHIHLFGHHADDLNQCCNHAKDSSCNHSDSCHDCGCDSPEVNFFKIKSQFTEEKLTFGKTLYEKVIQEIVLINPDAEITLITNINIAWLNNPPPAIPVPNEYIYFICKTKILDIA